MPSPACLVELRGVDVRAGATTVLRGIDLEIAGGEAVGVFGANGAGKTTLLRVIATLLEPSAGSGRVLGVALEEPDRFDVRRRIGLIGHNPALYPELTLRENLRFVADVAGLPHGAVDTALETVGLAGSADRLAAVCSYGMLRRAEFARELMRSPDLLLLDEPHTALDPSAVELVTRVGRSVTARGGAVVVVSHDRDRVASMVGRSAEVRDGALW